MTVAWFVKDAMDLAGLPTADQIANFDSNKEETHAGKVDKVRDAVWDRLSRSKKVALLRTWQQHVHAKVDFEQAANFKVNADDDALQRQLDEIADHAQNGRAEALDQGLALLDVDRIAPAAILDLVLLTKPLRDTLPGRDEFLARAKGSLVERIGAGRTNALLQSINR